ncbi:MAG: ISKra4 family transposase, partial [Acidobacteria bacterium]
MDKGKIESLVASLRSRATCYPGLAKTLQTEAHYFERNKERMRYPQFRKQGFFVGSGVIEAGCK